MTTVPTGFAEMLVWLLEFYPDLADDWVHQRSIYGMNAPDLEEWLAAAGWRRVLAEYHAWEAAHQTPPIEIAPEEPPYPPTGSLFNAFDGLVELLGETIDQHAKMLEETEKLAKYLRLVSGDLDSILITVSEWLDQYPTIEEE